mmetsp:Transcript_29615/g.72031  ORF Transcript_29615/g.72031 Transcript_29615/m.72031 type:complete len:204 (-) Transcript_29615:435-1046(-)
MMWWHPYPSSFIQAPLLQYPSTHVPSSYSSWAGKHSAGTQSAERENCPLLGSTASTRPCAGSAMYRRLACPASPPMTMCPGTLSRRGSFTSQYLRILAVRWSSDSTPCILRKSNLIRCSFSPSLNHTTVSLMFIPWCRPPSVTALSSCAIPIQSGPSCSMSEWITQHASFVASQVSPSLFTVSCEQPSALAVQLEFLPPGPLP